MSNTNCLKDIACPKCAHDEFFRIAVTGYAFVNDDGFSGVESPNWDDESQIICYDCNHQGTVRDFATPVQTNSHA